MKHAPPIYALTCDTIQPLRGAPWYRVTILRGPDCVTTRSELSIDLGRRLLTALADRYALTPADRAGLFTGSLVPFDIDQ